MMKKSENIIIYDVGKNHYRLKKLRGLSEGSFQNSSSSIRIGKSGNKLFFSSLNSRTYSISRLDLACPCP
jgi:hypothetical protein